MIHAVLFFLRSFRKKRLQRVPLNIQEAADHARLKGMDLIQKGLYVLREDLSLVSLMDSDPVITIHRIRKHKKQQAGVQTAERKPHAMCCVQKLYNDVHPVPDRL